jgi:hypothetical protein
MDRRSMVGNSGMFYTAYLTLSLILLSINQSQLHHVEGTEHCYAPFVLWLDKGNMTRRVQMHPIVLRAGWLPANIRNASGNGGGILIGFMPMVCALAVYISATPDDPLRLKIQAILTRARPASMKSLRSLSLEYTRMC